MGSDLLREKTCGEGETFTMQCAHGDVMTYPPLARVELEVEEKALMMKAVVSDTL